RASGLVVEAALMEPCKSGGAAVPQPAARAKPHTIDRRRTGPRMRTLPVTVTRSQRAPRLQPTPWPIKSCAQRVLGELRGRRPSGTRGLRENREHPGQVTGPLACLLRLRQGPDTLLEVRRDIRAQFASEGLFEERQHLVDALPDLGVRLGVAISRERLCCLDLR